VYTVIYKLKIVVYFEHALDRSKLPDTVFYRRPMDQMRRPISYFSGDFFVSK
jgi:hypothetical protein